VARLVDPAWLLDWQLTGGAEVTVAGRRGVRIRVSQRWPSADADRQFPSAPADAVIDTELGIVLRLTMAWHGHPSLRQELRGMHELEQPTDASQFRVEIPPGTRVSQGTSGLLDEIGSLPAAVRTSMQIAGKTVSGAVKAVRFLDSLRRAGHDRPPGP
jgi:hypothetical protein